MIVLVENQVTALCVYVEERIEKTACDHSLKNTFDWAEKNDIDKDDLIDVLESHGGYCDCEVAMNLPEDCDLKVEPENGKADTENPFKVPIGYKQEVNKLYSKAIFSSADHDYHNYTKDNELLLPAPYGFKAKKRVRKSVHFFNGTESELPTEIGFVRTIDPTNARDFAEKIRDLKLATFAKFTEREAGYYLSRVDRVLVGKPMATCFMERTDLGGSSIDLKIHKVIFRK